MALEWISGGTVAVEFASKSLNSLYFSLLQGIWQRTVRSGLDPPPHSLDCREIRLPCPENRRKSPQFLNFCSQTGPEKVSLSIPQASFRAFLSEGPTRSPVSATSLGERNAITNR